MSFNNEMEPQKTKVTIPFHLFGPAKTKDIDFDYDEISFSESFQLAQPRIKPLIGNELDKLVSSHTMAYFEEDNQPGATLVILSPKEVKDIILNPQNAPKEVCNLVSIKKSGTLIPGFLPDFGDFALFPLSLKIVLRWMFENSNKTPPLLKRLWMAASPCIPPARHETVVHYGLIRFSSFSFPSRLHLLKVPSPSKKDIDISVECKPVSSSHMDGRKYNFMLDINEKDNWNAGTEYCEGNMYEKIDRPQVSIMVWNCQGIGRPSFMANLKHLQLAHKPDIIVLLESRMSRHLLQSILRDNLLYKVVGMSPENIYGGVAVLSVHNKVQFVLEMRKEDSLRGCLKGQKLLCY